MAHITLEDELVNEFETISLVLLGFVIVLSEWIWEQNSSLFVAGLGGGVPGICVHGRKDIVVGEKLFTDKRLELRIVCYHQ